MQFSIAPHAQKALNILMKNGFEGYIVGGAIRDIIRGEKPLDYDIATNALPNEVKSIFERSIPTGEKHGTVTVIIDELPIEITTYRVDGDYRDARHPQTVHFSRRISDDLSRRDFTINAMACNGEEFIDLYGGQSDLTAKIIRTVGEAKQRFSEDALRILRAFRFSSVLNFKIEEDTLSACLEKAPLLQKISPERVFVELTKTICGKKPQAIEPLTQCGGLSFLKINSADISLLASLPALPELRYAVFCKLSNCKPQELLQTLRAPVNFTELVYLLYEVLSKQYKFSKPLIKHLFAKLPETIWSETISTYGLLYSEEISYAKIMIQEIQLNNEPYTLKSLAINGYDLQKLNIHGKQIGQILQQLLNEVIQNPLLNKKSILLELAKNIKDS